MYLAVIVFMLLILPLTSVWAQEEEEIPTDQLCSKKVLPELSKESSAFTEWMDRTFQNEAANSELLPEAVSRMKQFERQVIHVLDENFLALKGERPTEAALAYQKCLDVILETHDIVRKGFKAAVLANTEVKKTTDIVRRYKVINSRLRTMLKNIGIFSGHLTELNSKTPCYTRKCLR